MYIRILTLSLFCAVFFTACKDKKKTTGADFIISIPKSEVKNENFSDLFSKVRYVALETTKESLINRVDKLILGDSIILVWDRKSYAILLFDQAGKFISKISNQGRGPEEYVNITDVNIDHQQKKIILNDPGKQSLFYFDFKGKFLEYKLIKDFKLSGPTFIPFRNHILFNRGYYPIDGNYLGFFDKSALKLEHSLLPVKIKSIYGGQDFINSFCKQDSKLLFLAPLTNDIYEIDSTINAHKLYTLNFTGSNPDYAKINNRKFNSIIEFYEFINSQNYILDINAFVASNKYLYFNYSNKSFGLQNVFYKKGTQEAKLVTAVKGDLDLHVWAPIMASKGDELVSVIDNSEHVTNIRITHKMLPFNELQSNPVLAFYTMNDASF